MLLLDCPHCGQRNAGEFRYGGEYNPRPSPSGDASDGDWQRYLYLRRNSMDFQVEWWYHRAGCGTWFLVERERRSNTVARTLLWQPGGTPDTAEAR